MQLFFEHKGVEVYHTLHQGCVSTYWYKAWYQGGRKRFDIRDLPNYTGRWEKIDTSWGHMTVEAPRGWDELRGIIEAAIDAGYIGRVRRVRAVKAVRRVAV